MGSGLGKRLNQVFKTMRWNPMPGFTSFLGIVRLLDWE